MTDTTRFLFFGKTMWHPVIEPCTRKGRNILLGEKAIDGARRAATVLPAEGSRAGRMKTSQRVAEENCIADSYVLLKRPN